MTLQIRLMELDDYIEFGECRVPAGSSAGGQFARCGKAFSRMSAHPDDRRRPIASITLDGGPEDDAEAVENGFRDAKHWLMSAYTSRDLGGGYSSKALTFDEAGENRYSIQGRIMDSKGRTVGDFVREFVYEDRKLFVQHEVLDIESAHQGKGIADRFNAHAMAHYEALGVDRVLLSADWENGGYAWARQGFRIYGNEDEDRHQIIERLASGVRISGTTGSISYSPAKPTRQDRDELAALVRASAAGEDIQPIHLASIGESRRGDADSWFGKDLLRGSTWPGVYYLDRNNPVTASAVELRFTELRPAFRDGTEVMTLSSADWLTPEEFACHSAECRPPTSGGTGGSSHSIPSAWMKGATTEIDEDSHQPVTRLLTKNLGFSDRSVSEAHEIHDRWEGLVDKFRPTPSELWTDRKAMTAHTHKRRQDLVEQFGDTYDFAPGELAAAQAHVNMERIGEIHEGKVNDLRPIAVRDSDGTVFVMDGHHRVAYAWSQGKRATVDVVDLVKLAEAVK